MAKKRKSKGPIFQVKALEAWRTPGNYCDDEGGGLYLQVKQVAIGRKPATEDQPADPGVKQWETTRSGERVPKVRKLWVFRYWSPLPAGRRKLKEYSIGPFDDYTLAEAREIGVHQNLAHLTLDFYLTQNVLVDTVVVIHITRRPLVMPDDLPGLRPHCDHRGDIKVVARTHS